MGIDISHITLHPNQVKNLDILVDLEYGGVRTYCAKHSLDITDYLHAIRIGIYPPHILLCYIQDKLLIHKHRYLFMNFPELVRCSRHRLNKITTESKFAYVHDLENVKLLGFLNHYIFDEKVFSALCTDGYFLDDQTYIHREVQYRALSYEVTQQYTRTIDDYALDDLPPVPEAELEQTKPSDKPEEPSTPPAGKTKRAVKQVTKTSPATMNSHPDLERINAEWERTKKIPKQPRWLQSELNREQEALIKHQIQAKSRVIDKNTPEFFTNEGQRIHGTHYFHQEVLRAKRGDIFTNIRANVVKRYKTIGNYSKTLGYHYRQVSAVINGRTHSRWILRNFIRDGIITPEMLEELYNTIFKDVPKGHRA